jgi:hypothetical protein
MVKTRAGDIVVPGGGKKKVVPGGRKVIRFADLQERNIVNNWPSLKRWIENEGFPAGFRLGSYGRG